METPSAARWPLSSLAVNLYISLCVKASVTPVLLLAGQRRSVWNSCLGSKVNLHFRQSLWVKAEISTEELCLFHPTSPSNHFLFVLYESILKEYVQVSFLDGCERRDWKGLFFSNVVFIIIQCDVNTKTKLRPIHTPSYSVMAFMLTE